MTRTLGAQLLQDDPDAEPTRAPQNDAPRGPTRSDQPRNVRWLQLRDRNPAQAFVIDRPVSSLEPMPCCAS